jgi:hypothetical protein
MKPFRFLGLVLSSGFAASLASAQVPPMVNYQGRVAVGGTNFHGSGQFKFALVNGTGATTFWSNNGSSVAGSEPGAAVALSVANGLYSVQLGDATLPNMTAIPGTVFANPDVRLRVWFNDGVSGSQLLTPDQRITSVGYAMMAGNVPDGAISAAKLAPGLLNPTNLPANSVSSAQIADLLTLGETNVNGRLDVYRTAAGTPGVSLIGGSSQVSTYGSDGLEQTRLWGTTYGQLLLNDNTDNNTTVELTAEGPPTFIFQPFPNPPLLLPNPGAALYLRSGGGTNRVFMKASESGGQITLYQNDGGIGLFLDGDDAGAGAISVRSTKGSTRVLIDGQNSSGGGEIAVRKSDGANTVVIDGASAQISTYGSDGQEQIRLWGLGYGEILLKDSSAENRTAVRLSANGTGGGLLQLTKGDGSTSITLDADVSGEGRITTQVLQITGGSDLSEQFDIKAMHAELKAGMIVSIDPDQPGQLVTSTRAYDKTVAGIVSGAGGVKTGMLMGQRGTAADGKHPVALTGRVYCWVDADQGAIRPGDLITTSDLPGYGMKVQDHQKAQGATIGKAMTKLENGRGLVLVLVSLQ